MKGLVSSVVLAVVSVSGCSSGEAPPTAGPPAERSRPDGSGALHERYPRLSWKWVEENGDGMESTGSPISAGDRSFRIVADTFRRLPWHAPLSRPSIAVELAGDRSMAIRLSADSTNEHPNWIAVHREPGPKYGNTTSVIVRRSRRLQAAEQALRVLRSYVRGDGDYESLVEWVNHGGDSSADD